MSIRGIGAWRAFSALGAAALIACGGDDAPDGAGAAGAAPRTSSGAGGDTGSGLSGSGAAGAGADTTGTTAGGGGTTSGGGGSGGGPDLSLGCKGMPPPGATLASPPKAYAGTCPTLPQITTPDVSITSSGSDRKFWLVVPANLAPGEDLPVIFLWHWLNGGAQGFFDKGEVQAAVDEQRFLAIIPEEKGDLQFTWPYSTIDGAGRLEEEAVFFDDMLSCVSAQFSVVSDCVASAGVSAGALFTDQLVGVRGDWIASFMSLSGGTGGALIKPWTAPQHRMPGFVLWGGPTDNCFGLMNFEQTSGDLEQNLSAGGHFFLECIHNCGHAVPPFEPPPGSSRYKSLWQFALDHPFWLKAGESPYAASLPADLPEWCGVGAGSATPRTGPCPDGPGC